MKKKRIITSGARRFAKKEEVDSQSEACDASRSLSKDPIRWARAMKERNQKIKLNVSLFYSTIIESIKRWAASLRKDTARKKWKS